MRIPVSSRLWRSFLALTFVIGAAAIAIRAQQLPLQAQAPAAVPNEFLVRYVESTTEARRSAALRDSGAALVRRYAHVGIDHVRLPAGVPMAAIDALRATGSVLSVDPNYVRTIVETAPPNDQYWLSGFMWGLTKISAQPAWTTFTTGSTAIVVADLDTGINYNHPDLSANVWTNPGEIPGNGVDDDGNGYVDDVYGIDTYNSDSDPMDDHGHGTHTAGTIGARGNNGIGVVGVNWNVKVLGCKFIGASGIGSDAGAIACLNYLVNLKNRGVNIRVTNNSWGGPRGPGPPSQSLKAAFDAAGNAGILNVAAAGNDNNNNDAAPFDPASFTSTSIIAVAASDSADNRAGFSNYGATSVDLAAPGVSILSTYGSSYAYISGTSMAAPHVAGAAALVLARDSSLTVSALKTVLMNSVDHLAQWNNVVASGGRLNVYNALLSLTPNNPPNVQLTEPTEGATFTAPASITVSATASDPGGSVSSVAFFADGNSIGSDTTSPYSVGWPNPAAGSHTLTAVATDNLGATTTSAAVHITVNTGGSGSTFSLTPSPLSVAPGGSLSISWTAPAGQPIYDWIALYRVGDPSSSYLWWTYTGGAPTGTVGLTAPTQAGQYEFRYLLNNGYTDAVRSAPVTVTSGGGGGGGVFSLSPNPTTVAPNGALSISWTAPAGRPSTDWIALYRAGESGGGYLWWQYTSGLTTGTASLSAPSQPGQYVFRYLLQNGYTESAVSVPVTVAGGGSSGEPTLSVSPSSVGPGGTVVLTWTAPAGSATSDWIGLYRVGDPSTSYLWWQYTQGQQSATVNVTAPLQPGQYEFRYFLRDSYTRAATSGTFTVGGAQPE